MRAKIIENRPYYPCFKIRNYASDGNTSREGFIVEFTEYSMGTVVRQKSTGGPDIGHHASNWIDEVFMDMTPEQLKLFEKDINKYLVDRGREPQSF